MPGLSPPKAGFYTGSKRAWAVYALRIPDEFLVGKPLPANTLQRRHKSARVLLAPLIEPEGCSSIDQSSKL
jgi:hypothetical protein